MYRSFSIFSVSDERELRDPQRVRALERKRNNGTRVGVALMGLGSLVCFALAAGGVYVKLAATSAPPEAGWTMLGIGLFFGLMMLAMALAFHKEVSMCALGGYLKYPQRYEFVKGSLDKADYLSDGKSSSAKMMVWGSYGEGGLFAEEFDPSVWSNAVAERGEESLKPGDDRYDQKGKRVRLPIEVWVLHEVGVRAPGYLAGIPAETVARLTRK